MQNLFSVYGFMPVPGMRDCFMRKEPGDEWIILMKRIRNGEKYCEHHFEIIHIGEEQK